MSRAKVLASRLRGLIRRKRLERELDEEVGFHLDSQIQANIESGMSPADARYAALRSFGPMEPMKEAYRERRAFAWVEATAQDVRYALRALRNSPGFTITSVVVLALAIGANTAMFSVLNAVLIRPLPYPSPEQLVMLWSEIPSQNVREGRTAYWNVEQWRTQSKSFADLAFFDSVSATLTNSEGAEKISVVRHSPNLFALLGVKPSRGRSFSAREAELRQRVALISHRFWQTRFAGSENTIGSTIVIDGLPSEIVGILPDDFEFLKLDGDVWEPHTMFADWESVRQARGSGFWAVLGRLRPTATVAQAQSEMNAIARSLDAQLPAALRNRGVSVVPLDMQVTGRNARLALWTMAGAVFCVLLIAATNAASLTLARSATREKEIAVRAALGATYARIIRQLLAESLTLALFSGLLGCMIAVVGLRLILAKTPVELARLSDVTLDARVLGGALALCLFTGIVVGLTPAVTLARRSLRPADQEGARGVAGGVSTRRTRRVLVVTEFALAVVLLVSAGLLTRSLWSVESLDLGFRPEQVLSVQLSTTTFSGAMQRANFYSQALEETESLPGVQSAGIVSELFIGGNSERAVIAEGNRAEFVERLRLRSDEASQGFFKAVGTPLLRGRFFSPADGPDAPPVAIINDAMARRLWPGIDPVGKRFKASAAPSSPWLTVIGVVGDMRRQGIENTPIPQMFESLAQNPPRLATLLVRTDSDDPLKMAGTVQAAIRRVEKHVPVYGITTLNKQLAVFMAQRRFETWLLLAFSTVALIMAAVGIYGLIQYSISTRTHEIGIRMAVGAQAGEIFRMMISEGLKLSLAGLIVGLAGALWVGRATSSLLFGVTATDPLTFLAVSLLLMVVAAAACYFPARRAMRVDPMVTLRQE